MNPITLRQTDKHLFIYWTGYKEGKTCLFEFERDHSDLQAQMVVSIVDDESLTVNQKLIQLMELYDCQQREIADCAADSGKGDR